MPRLTGLLVIASITAITSITPITSAEGIPAFARRYKVTCALCHDPVPRLTTFGNQFAANGFMMTPGDTTGMQSNGDALLLLNETLPLAIRFDAYGRYVTGSGGTTDFQLPYTAKILSGGQITRSISYYMYFMLSEDGSTGGLEDAWVSFKQPISGVPLDVVVGQFQVIDPVWKRELRLTIEDYQILSTRPGSASAGLTYDRGVGLFFSPADRTAIIAQIVNGNGIGPAAAGTFDGDRPKSGSLIAQQGVGPFQFSLLGYYGNQQLTPTGGTGLETNRTRMLGPAATLRLSSLDLGAQYLYRDDTDPDFVGSPSLTTTRGGFLEAVWWPRGRGGRWSMTGLYNNVNSSYTGVDYETGTVNMSWLAARNLRLAAETTWDFIRDRASIGLGVVTAF